MKRKTHVHTFLRGLETTGREDGLELPAWVHFLNTRVEDGAASPRPGMQRVHKFTPSQLCYDFNGAADYLSVPLDTRVHDLGMYWTLETLFQPDDVAGTHALLAWATTSPLYIYTDSTTLKVKLTHSDSGPTTKEIEFDTTVLATGTTYALQVTRDGDTLYANLNGTEKTKALVADTSSETPVGSMLIANDGSNNYFSGKIDFIRLLDTVWRDGEGYSLRGLWQRFPDPRARYVLFDYVCQDWGRSYIEDRSRWENHAIVTGSPTEVTSLSVAYNPITMLHERLDWDGKQYLDVKAGPTTYAVEVGR